jgi:hypothetical protein
MSAVDAALSSPTARADWVACMAAALADRRRRTARMIDRTGRPGADDGRCFRWHDSGDLQGLAHLDMIVEVAERTPSVEHWLPTREVGTVMQFIATGKTFPANLTVRISAPRVDARPAVALRALARQERVALSAVHSGAAPADGFEVCTAYLREGACDTCRRCWNPSRDVSYPLH